MNPQPTVLETVALPIELLPYARNRRPKAPNAYWLLDDLRESTMVVIVSVFVLSILLGIVDRFLSYLLTLLLSGLA